MPILQISKSQQNLELNPSGISHQKVVLCHDTWCLKNLFFHGLTSPKRFSQGSARTFLLPRAHENPASVCGATADVSEPNDPNKMGINEGSAL